MKKTISGLIIIIMLINILGPLSIAVEDTSDVVTFEDEKLKQAFITTGADSNGDGNLTKEELNQSWITSLYLYESITSISGIEYATNLTEVRLYNLQNNIDFSKLNELPNLTKLAITGNITDITALQQLEQLEELNVGLSYSNNNTDIEPIRNLKNLVSLSISGAMDDISPIEDLSKLKELEISIWNVKDPVDINIIGNLEALEKINIYNVRTDISPLGNLKNVKDLSLSFSTNINTDIVENMINLEKLSLYNLYGKIPDLSKLSKLKELKLGLTYENYYDMNKIISLNTLEKIELSGTFEDISALKELTNLKEITLTNQYYNTNSKSILKEKEFLDTINQSAADTVRVDGTYCVDLGSIICGESKEFTFKEINPIVESIMNEESKLYNPDLQLSVAGDTTDLTIDNENKTIKVTADEFGDNYVYVDTNSSYGDNGFSGRLVIKWHNSLQGDTTKKIEFKDENLKNALLENYDIDGDKRITENDMINCSTLDLSNKNITDITGLQYAINLAQLNIASNEISDISCLENLKTLNWLNISNNQISNASSLKSILSNDTQTLVQNNLLEDITCLAGCDFGSIDLKGNYIDFSEESSNRKVVEDSVEAIARKEYVESEITDQTEEEYVQKVKQCEIVYIIDTWYYLYEKYGSVEERNDEVEFESALKQALIKSGVDNNNDNKITKGELNDFGQDRYWEQPILDLSNLEITNIDGLKYLSGATKIDLSNNNITDISPLKECRALYSLDLSNNNISNIQDIGELYSIQDLNLSNNNIIDIDTLKNLRTKNPVSGHDGYWAGGGGPDRSLSINLSNNKISSISVVNELRALKYMDLSNNVITDISFLKDFNFQTEDCQDEEYIDEYELLEYFKGINLSGNFIDVQDTNNKTAISKFEEKNVKLNLENQKKYVPNEDEVIEEINSKQNVILDVNPSTVVQSSIFEGLADNENVELTIVNENATWKFNSDDIKNTDIDLDTSVTISDSKFENISGEEIKEGIFVKFSHEGELPGQAEIELDISTNGLDIEKEIYLYYYNPTTRTYEHAGNVEVVEGKAKITLNHCSDYVITNEQITILGDVNADGKINTLDAIMVLQHISHKITLTDKQKLAADTSKDGKINTLDVIKILQYISHKITQF